MISYTTRHVIDDDLQSELEAFRKNPRAQAYLKAAIHLTTLRMSASLFGVGEAWVQSQLTDDERATLAHEAERVEQKLLPG